MGRVGLSCVQLGEALLPLLSILTTSVGSTFLLVLMALVLRYYSSNANTSNNAPPSSYSLSIVAFWLLCRYTRDVAFQ